MRQCINCFVGLNVKFGFGWVGGWPKEVVIMVAHVLGVLEF